MKLGNGSEHLLVTALFYFAVGGDNRKAVFSIHVTSPKKGDISNVSFSRDAFQRFYNCLLSSRTCTIRYTQSYTKTHTNNVLHVRSSHQSNYLLANREKRTRTSLCTKTRTDTLKCQNKGHDKDNHELGVRPIWQCGHQACPCVYLGQVRQISYDNKDFQECPRKIQISSTFRRLRARRASRSSSRSSSRGSKSSSRSSWSPSSNSGSGTNTDYRTSNSSSSDDSNVGLFVAVTLGTMFLALIPFLIRVVCNFLSKRNSQNNVTSNSITRNAIKMADAASEENGQRKSQFVFSEMTPDTEFSNQNGDIFRIQTITHGNEMNILITKA